MNIQCTLHGSKKIYKGHTITGNSENQGEVRNYSIVDTFDFEFSDE